MSTQAKNSLNLYRGQNPATIIQLLRIQHSDVVNELKKYFNCTTLDELALRCSLGR